MKHIKIILIAAIVLGLSACGSDDGVIRPEGPILSLDEATAIVVDQFYINGGMEDEYAANGEFSVYLRDAATGKDVACTSADDGMEKLSRPGIYYGGLSIPFRAVEGDVPSSMARFQLLFVEQDSAGCPKPISTDDDIAGQSAEISFDNLLGQKIWASNGRAAVVLRAAADSKLTVSQMAPALEDSLVIDEIYFDDGSSGTKQPRYYLFAEEMVNGRATYQCQVEDSLMADILYGGIVYSALGFPISCFDPKTSSFASTEVHFSLYAQRDSGPELVGETEAELIGELIGERAPFVGGQGYISFRGVMETPFSSRAMRLEELTGFKATGLEYKLTPSASSTVELHMIDAQAGYTIACTGPDQGLVGVGAPGSYTGLSAQFVAVDGQKELFGWNGVKIELIDRGDGLKCPNQLVLGPKTLATTDTLLNTSFTASTIAFSNGAGSVTVRVGQ